jgi:hypothetical protein
MPAPLPNPVPGVGTFRAMLLGKFWRAAKFWVSPKDRGAQQQSQGHCKKNPMRTERSESPNLYHSLGKLPEPELTHGFFEPEM